MNTNETGSTQDPNLENQKSGEQNPDDQAKALAAAAEQAKEKAKSEKAPKATKPAKAEKATSENTFKLEGKTYKVLIPKMNIPELGVRTALEVCADPEAQQALIDCKCIGSVLEEVVE